MSNVGGRTIGKYQVVAELGRGGMAVVYKAWQSSLDRYVALKTLPPYFQHDPQFLARFQREAKAAARLNHPSIVTIYDVGEQAGVHYIAMEYLEGGSLQDRLATSTRDLREAQRILDQVAGALDYAHSRGLIHRDVKPANILFTADGRAKVTDFGIARASDGTQLTRTGVVMGTPEYMAPEQAEGGSVDHRTDLYALGVVLYQMLTGRAPFQGTTPHATLHAVIYEAPPPPRQINPGLSPAVEAVLLKALAKEPAQRFQRGAEMVAAFRAAVAGTELRRPPVAPPRRSPLVWLMAGLAAVLVLALGLLLLLAGGGGGEETPSPATTEAIVWQTATTAVTPTGLPATSIATVPGPARTPFPASETPALPTETPLPATDTPAPPTETPPLAFDTPVPATDTPVPPTKTPGPTSGRLAFTSKRDGNPEIYVVDLAGGSPVRLTNNQANDWLPDWAPDGAAGASRIAFTSNRQGGYDLWAMAGDGSGALALVTTDAWDDYARWAPDGRQLALSTTSLTQGVANSEIFVRRADGQLVQRTSSTAEDQWPDWSPDGRIVYTEGFKGSSNWDILIMSTDGSNWSVWLGGPACDVQPTWSPDGQWIAFLRVPRDTNGNGQVDELDAGDVWVGRVSGGELRQLTSGAWASTPAWSPDSRWVAFTWLRDSNGNGRSDEGDAADIWTVPAGGGDALPLVKSPHWDGDPSWTN
jgi:serine/threonine protein kinase/Tol biopolymer transport system component